MKFLAKKLKTYNHQRSITDASATNIKWIPGSDSLFIVSYHDGIILTFDKDLPEYKPHPEHGSNGNGGNGKDTLQTPTHGQNANGREGNESVNHIQFSKGNIAKIGTSNNTSFQVIKPEPNSNTNPRSCWYVSQQPIKGMEFSPDTRHLATVGRDGVLRIFDFKEERLVVGFKSYFGGLSCVSWSPDGKYLLTGGEDDLVSIWDFEGRRIVARCEGHQSWVTGLSFDQYKCDDKIYRFGSVGEDTKLLVWDFSVGALSRPRSQSGHRKQSLSKNSSLKPPRSDPLVHSSPLSSQPAIIESSPRAIVPTIEPIMSRKVHIEPLSSVAFREDSLLTACRRAHIKTWLRPEFLPPSSEIPKDVDNDK